MKRLLNVLALAAALNVCLFATVVGWWWLLLLVPFGLGWYIKFSILPRREKRMIPKIQGLIGGYEIIIDVAIVTLLEIAAYATLIIWGPDLFWSLIINGIIFLLLSVGLLVNGGLRIFILSSQLGVTLRAAMLVLGWVPVANLVLFGHYARVARAEYLFETAKYDLNTTRIDSQICKTRYPIVLVHGIFFRDWKHVNYWGRIPAELVRNGAKVYYGGQQSAASIADNAAELCKTVHDVMRREKVDKVNIIAHSKGGIDARYMISKLGMASHVASLTTINTPNRGTPLADRLLRIVPDRAVQFVARRYNQAFKKLGDDNPDFYTGVRELSEENMAKIAQDLENKKGVLYQSVGSKMVSPSSTVLPLSLGYAIISLDGADNDGLVPVESFANGKYLGTIKTADGKGLGHGDMVDITRRNLGGFDVREFYVKLVADLKKKGL
jgi:triacylglycerol lipase